MKSQEKRVRDELDVAMAIARDYFDEPSEAAVMSIFHRLAVLNELTQIERPRLVSTAVH